MRLRLILIPLFFTWLCAAEPSQNFSFRTIRQDQGLSHNGIRSIIVDSRGYVWIGTQMGLNRFDGVRARSYYRDDLGLSSNFISSLCEDHLGNIWIGTSEGIAVYDYMKDSFWIPDSKNRDLSNSHISSIACNSKGEIWVSTNKGFLFTYDKNNNVFIRRDVNLGHGTVRLAFDLEDNPIIVSSTVNLFRYSNEKVIPVNPVNYPDIFAQDELWGPVSRTDVAGLIYVSTKKHGVFEVDLKRNTAKHILNWERDEKPTGLSLENNRVLWCASTSGIIRVELGSGNLQRFRHSADNPFSISEDYLCCIATDAKGNVWAGTSRNGVSFSIREMNRFDIHVRTDSGEVLNNCVIRGFSEDASGTVWIATERMGLLRYLPREKSIERVDSPEIPQFLCDVVAENDQLWLGTQYGLLKYRVSTGKVTKYLTDNSANENRVTELFITDDGQLYVGLLTGLWTYVPRTDSFIQVPGLENVCAGSFVEDKKGNIWIATYSTGVFRLSREDNSVTSFTGKTQMMTSSVFRDRSGNIWVIGRDSEIARYNEESGEFQRITSGEDSIMPKGVIMCAEQGNEGHIWISTTSGLVIFDTSSLSVSALYDTRSGLLENDFSQSSTVLRDGTCLFGSTNGFISFPSDLSAPVNQKINIDALFIGEKEIHPYDKQNVIKSNINIADEIHIGPNKSFFSIRLSSNGISSPVIVSCQLVGHDKTPAKVYSDAQLNFYDVQPGKYVLKISGHKDIVVTVDPPFLESPLGIAILVVALMLFASLLVYVANKRQRARSKRNEAEFKMKQEEEMVKEKMNFLSSVVHEIKTPLTLIKTPLQNLSATDNLTEQCQKDIKIISNSTDYLDKLSKELLEFVKVEEFGYVLSPESIDLIETISFLCFNFSDAAKNRNLRIEFRHDEDRVFVNADEKALRKILNNLLHNALKYAESYFSIDVQNEGSVVNVRVRNDGPEIPEEKREAIFKPFVRVKEESSEYTQSFGIGLSLARKLAILHGGSLTLSPSRETEFVFSIPSLEQVQPVDEEPKPKIIRQNGKPNILVVEDNDSLSGYLKEKLSSEFNPIIVSTAESGLSLLKTVNVDMVLTDISMPGIGGVELCKRIKSSPSNAGLPIIVISAIASESAKIESIRNGANIFIEKPFTIDYLIASINSLLNKVHFDQTQSHIPNVQISIEDRDAKFLSNLNSIIERHISDESFSVKQLEDELFMSHSSLNRKMASLLNATPVDYMRTVRLQAAAAILKDNDVNVSEVCYMVGFSTRQYFYKCFKDYYGIAPVEYAKKYKI